MNAKLFQDVLMSMILGMLFLTVTLLASVTKKAEDAAAGIKPPGNLIVAITWPNEDTDIDLWLDGPGEDVPVQYNHKNGSLWDLLRDDRGTGDQSSFNYEDAYTRGVVEGEYTINVVCFRGCEPGKIPVDVEVSINPPDGGTATVPILKTKVLLEKFKQEKTAARFMLTKEGRVVEGSVHNIFKPLRGASGT
jgi:hypothetical protein